MGKFKLVKRRDDYYRHFTALDIGTDMVKALVVRRDKTHGTVLGVGREPQDPIAMSAAPPAPKMTTGFPATAAAPGFSPNAVCRPATSVFWPSILPFW